jgi:WD40 repeat protein
MAALAPYTLTLVTVDGNGEKLKLWKTETGEAMGTLAGHAGGTLALGWSVDGRTLYSVGRDQALRVWDIATKAESRKIALPMFDVAALGPDGLQRAHSTGSGVTVVDVVSGRTVKSITAKENGVEIKETFNRLQFAPDGKTLFTVSTGAGAPVLRVWDPAAGRQVRSLKLDDASGFFELAPDGKKLLWGGKGLLRELRVVHAQSGVLLATLPVVRDVTAVEFISDGRLAVADDDVLYIRPPELNAVVATLGGARGVSAALAAVSRDGKTVASAGPDGVLLWDVAAGRQSGRVEAKGLPSAVAFLEGRRVLAGFADGMLRVWDGDAAREVASVRLDGAPVGVATSATRFAAVDETGVVTLCDGKLAGVERSWKAGEPGAVRCVALSPDGKRLVTGDKAGTLSCWDAKTGERRLEPVKGRSAASAMAFAPVGSSLAVLRADGSVSVHVGATLEEKRSLAAEGGTAPAGAVAALAWRADGKRLVVSGLGGWATVWDPEGGRAMTRIPGCVGPTAWMPDGKRLATALPVRIWTVRE